MEPFSALRQARILVVDDEESMRTAVRTALGRRGAEVEITGSIEDARQILSTSAFDAAVIDIKLGDGDGLKLLAEMRESQSDPVVVIITAHASVEKAVEALRHDAADFLTKPFSPDQIRAAVDRAIRHRRMSEDSRRLRTEVRERHIGAPFRSRAPVMREVDRLIQKAAPADSTVLLLGENGVGKEVYALHIHESSRRRSEPFVVVNCAAMPEPLIESEVFGHTKGAFTGASADRRGAVQFAAGGTLFLDEIGDLPLLIQPKFLRMIEAGEIRPLGSDRTLRVDVRLIAATNKDIEAEVRAGRFREDLFFRLNVIPVRLPPLRERLEDILPLAEEFIRKFSREMKRPVKQLSEDASAMLSAYPWPGNIRELRNSIERAMILCEGAVISASDFALTAPSRRPETSGAVQSMDDLERSAIETALRLHGGHKAKTAKSLGISSATLWRKMKAYRIDAAI